MEDFKNTIKNKLRKVHNNSSIQLFKQISNYIESSLAQSLVMSDEERVQHLASTILKINNLLNSEVNNENVRNIIRENLLSDFDLFLNPPPPVEETIEDDSDPKKKDKDITSLETE